MGQTILQLNRLMMKLTSLLDSFLVKFLAESSSTRRWNHCRIYKCHIGYDFDDGVKEHDSKIEIEQFFEIEDVREHEDITSTGSPPGPPYACEQCNKSFSDATNLRRHIVNVHNGNTEKPVNETKFSCDNWMESSFNSNVLHQSLYIHERKISRLMYFTVK